MRSEDNGDNWVLINLPDNPAEVNSIVINSNDDIFTTTYDGRHYRSTDSGDSWTQLYVDSTHISFNCIDINSFDVIFIGTDNGVLRSTNNGDILEKTGWKYSVDNLAISPEDDIFIISGNVFRSIDNGDSWTESSLGLTNTGVNDFAFNSFDQILIGTAAPNGGVFISIDSGDNWTTTGYSFQSDIDSVVTSFTINSSDDIFIGTIGIGVVCSIDNGNSWIKINSGLPYDQYYGYPIVASFIFNTKGYILVGTFNGIFRSEQIVTTKTEADDCFPKQFKLEQNYPNPFNPTTTIRYDIPKTSQVTLTIYNMNGQVVERLVNQKQEPGFYSISWDTRNVSTGMYFYRINADGFQQVKKMLLIK